MLLERVYIVARASNADPPGPKEALEDAIKKKLERLAVWQKLKLAAPNQDGDGEASGGGSYTERLTAKIVNNLQIRVNKV